MDGYEGSLSLLRWQLADLRMQAASLRVSVFLKAGFRPDQPRVPRGQADGGRGSPATRRYIGFRAEGRAAGRSGSGGRWHPVTPAQEARLAQSHGAMRRALREVREVDPAWWPPAQAYSSVEGLISANRAIELEARFRIFQLLRTRAEPGPYAREWIPAPATNRRFTRAEQREIDRLGRKWGCHRCGSKNSGVKSGSFIGDHQVPKSMGTPTRIYPHCARCSASQGGLMGMYRRRNSE